MGRFRAYIWASTMMRRKTMKRKMWNRILSIFIAAALMVSALPMNAVAEGNETFVEEVDVTPATTEEAQPEESGGSEENYLESSNV